MNKDLLMERIAALCKERGINLTTAFEQSGVGKNFRSNLKTSNPSKKNLFLLAEYFNVSVEYLLGEETTEDLARRTMGLVVEWLIDNNYEYSEEEDGTVYIAKDGDSIHLAMGDFANECMAIKKISEDGFELAMLDWERRTFASVEETHHNIISRSKNIINDSPHATLTINDTDLSKQERELIKMYREFSLEEQLALITYALKVKNGEV